jgi:transposase
MSLSKEERIELVLLSGREGWSVRKIADDFNARHPRRTPIGFSTVGKVVRKFKETGSVMDKPRSGRPSVSDETKETIMAKFTASPRKSLRRTAMELGVPKTTISRILKEQRFHPYKLQILHHLTEDDPDRRLEMCEWFSNKLDENDRFTEDCVLFSDEALFYVNGEVNRQNVRYWSQNNPHWVDHSKQQGAQKIMVWCGLWKAHVLGPFFFDNHVTGATYLTMLRDQVMPQLERLDEGLPEWFQQDGAPAHFATVVRDWLNDTFSNWIGRRGHVEWSPRSPDLSPLDLFFWGMLKEKVYSMKIRDMRHLRERIISECAQIDGNVELMHRVHVNLAKRIDLCIANGGNHIEDVIY